MNRAARANDRDEQQQAAAAPPDEVLPLLTVRAAPPRPLPAPQSPLCPTAFVARTTFPHTPTALPRQFLRENGDLEHVYLALRDRLGVQTLEDLSFLEETDFAQAGLILVERRKLAAAVARLQAT